MPKANSNSLSTETEGAPRTGRVRRARPSGMLIEMPVAPARPQAQATTATAAASETARMESAATIEISQPSSLSSCTMARPIP